MSKGKDGKKEFFYLVVATYRPFEWGDGRLTKTASYEGVCRLEPGTTREQAYQKVVAEVTNKANPRDHRIRVDKFDIWPNDPLC